MLHVSSGANHMGASGMAPATVSAGMHLGMGAAAGAAACASATFQQVPLHKWVALLNNCRCVVKLGDVFGHALPGAVSETSYGLVLQVQPPMAMHGMDGLSPYGSSNMLMSPSRELFYVLPDIRFFHVA